MPQPNSQTPLDELLQSTGEVLNESDFFAPYFARHDIEAAANLTVTNDEMAAAIAERLAPRISGKVVVEIGGGIGLLAFHLAGYAKQVFCIEANPVWASGFLACLFEAKPKNCSYLFGAAEEFAGQIKADVALFCTHSGVSSMTETGRQFAPVVIDFYGEMIAANPAAFDPLARTLRPFASIGLLKGEA